MSSTKGGCDSCCVLHKCQCHYRLLPLNNDDDLQSISHNPQDVMYVMYVICGLGSNFIS